MWWDALWEVEGLVSVKRWSCNRGASCVVGYTIGGWGLVCSEVNTGRLVAVVTSPFSMPSPFPVHQTLKPGFLGQVPSESWSPAPTAPTTSLGGYRCATDRPRR